MATSRKSLIAKYKNKAKARGKKTSTVKRSKTPVKSLRTPILEMTIDGETYKKGDVAWYVIEANQYSKRPHTGEILECHPNDRTAPCVSVWDQTMGNYRTIRASLVGWSKAEAKKKWENYLKQKD